MKYLIAIALSLMATPTIARCHYSADGQWWTNAEMAEIDAIVDKLKDMDPTSNDNPAAVAAALDRMECAGMTHAGAIKNVFELAASRVRIKAMQQEQQDKLR
jgi:hypothetical protein